MKKKLLSLFCATVLAVLAVVGLVSCGTDDDSSSGTNTQNRNFVTLSMWVLWEEHNPNDESVLEIEAAVEEAFNAIHHKEMMPRAMAYGMERAKQQMGQTIQAQRRRPTEGAMKSQGQPQAADFNIDIRGMKPGERKKIYDLIHKGKMTWG